MIDKTYSKSLKLLNEVDFSDNLDRVKEKPSELLRWSLINLLIGNSIEKGKGWLEEQLNQPPFTGKPIAEFFRLANLVALEKLFDTDDTNTLKKAIEFLPELESQAMFDTDRAVTGQIAIGLSMLSGDKNSVNFWRKKRLQQEMYNGWESSAFEILYSSSSRANEESLTTLGKATARVAVKTLFDRNQDSTVPLVAALAYHSARNNKPIIETLYKAADSLDNEVFSKEGFPLFKAENNLSRISKEASKINLRISQRYTGSGRLTTGNCEFAPFTTHLTMILSKHLKKINVRESDRKKMIECVLKINNEIKINETQMDNLKSRISVGVEHAKNLFKNFEENTDFELKIISEK